MRKSLLMLTAFFMLVGMLAPLAPAAVAAEQQLTLGVDGMI